MKRAAGLATLFLCIFLVYAASLAAAAGAEESRMTRSGDFTYTLNRDDTVTIIQYTGAAEEVTVPGALDGHPVAAIGNATFLGHREILGVTLPPGLKHIGDEAFAYCETLRSAALPEGLLRIGDGAFSRCFRLESLALPGSLEKIGANPFVASPVRLSLDSGQTRFDLEGGSLIDKADGTLIAYFDYSGAEGYTVPPDVRAIGASAFYMNGSLVSVILPQGLERIGEGAFDSCHSLNSLILPDGLRSIGDYAFFGCIDLISVSFPPGLESIGDSAFEYCENLSSAAFPEGLLSIGDAAFWECTALSSVTLPEGLLSIGDSAFGRCYSLESLSLPASLEEIGINPFESTPLRLSLEPGHHRFVLDGGALIDKETGTLISYLHASGREEFVVPEGVRAIGAGAFVGNEDLVPTLVSVILPQGLERVGDYAFSGCTGLQSILLPDTVTRIGQKAFAYCESLAQVDFPAGLVSIGDHAFDYCGSLVSADLPEALLTIGGWAFGHCNRLLSATLPASVTGIGEYAFEGCPDLALRVTQDSFAQLWARKKGFPAQFADKGTPDKDAPFIPDGTLVPLDIKLLKDKKYPVYTGPGEDYARAGDGKGSVSTKGWVQSFGLEGDWLLIQYRIHEGQMRFGYISAKGLKQEGRLADLASRWEGLTLVLKDPAILTDDPLASMNDIAQLPAGARVRSLGWMGSWAYVEARDGKHLLRGFIPSGSLEGAASPGERMPFDLRAVSWGPLEMDEAQRRYYHNPTIGSLLEGGAPLPNVWLRLDSLESRADLETLREYRVVAGRASCGVNLVPLPAYDSRMEDAPVLLHFMPRDGFSRGALEITLEEGESLGNVVIAVTRALPDGREETLTLPLAGVPRDSGYPSGGVSFTALRITPFVRTPERMAAYQARSGKPVTLGGVLEEMGQAMPDAPTEVLNLPHDTPDYLLYLLEGRILKEHGPFGVYDVIFSLENPPEGVWLAACQQCPDCTQIDAFDMFSSDVLLPDGLLGLQTSEDSFIWETLSRDFAILVLVGTRGRDEGQIVSLVRDLQVHAAFSAEKWNARYEQHTDTTAIGPRSGEWVRMDRLVMAPGPLSEIPIEGRQWE